VTVTFNASKLLPGAPHAEAAKQSVAPPASAQQEHGMGRNNAKNATPRDVKKRIEMERNVERNAFKTNALHYHARNVSPVLRRTRASCALLKNTGTTVMIVLKNLNATGRHSGNALIAPSAKKRIVTTRGYENVL